MNWSLQTTVNVTRALGDDDRIWVAENLLRGGDPASLVATLSAAGRPAELVRREIEEAAAHPYVTGAMRARELWKRRLGKANWALDALAKLDRQAFPENRIPVVADLSTEEFYDRYYLLNRPVAINGRLSGWPAMTRWTPDYFVERWGASEVEVQARRQSDPQFEIQAAKHVAKMKVAELIAQIRDAHTNDFYLTARNSAANRLALPGLWDDVGQIPEYLAPTDPPAGFFWLGPAGTLTPSHHDLTNNMMAQVVGRKRMLIAPMVFQPHIYNHLHVYSQVDLARIDTERFPEMREVRVIEHILEPGQLLFLPIGCWHQVEALDFSATMTFTNFKLDNDFASFYRANGEL